MYYTSLDGLNYDESVDTVPSSDTTKVTTPVVQKKPKSPQVEIKVPKVKKAVAPAQAAVDEDMS